MITAATLTLGTEHHVGAVTASPEILTENFVAVPKPNAEVIAHSPGAELAASGRFLELALPGLPRQWGLR